MTLGSRKGALTFLNIFAIFFGWVSYLMMVPILSGFIASIIGATGCEAGTTCATFLAAIPILMGICLLFGTIWLAKSPSAGTIEG